ncbi:MAG: hypothetical protein V7K73_03400 [Nostoc sp.]
MTDLSFGENDLWIASIALQQNLTIISADSDFQRIQQVRTLSVESWLTISKIIFFKIFLRL